MPASQTRTVEARIDPARLAEIDGLVLAAIKAKQLPGAIVLVGQDHAIVYRKAFGNRALEPAAEPMTLDTIFDMASVTKVVATTTSVMLLIEDGQIRLADRVSAYIPGFERYGKADITVRHLLTHTSGLRPDLDLGDPWSGYDTAIARAVEEVPTAPAGERFVYSDINFFLLGDIVGRVSGLPLDRFTATRIFQPLGMLDTTFNPPAALRDRIAPTEREGPGLPVLRGVVHDPTARRMGGVAGHAGLFSTASDMSVFCRMLLGAGQYGRTRILGPLTVTKMSSPATPPGMASLRGLGWDIDSAYSSNRGSGTRGSPELRSGSIRSRALTSSFSRTVCTRTARAT
jgi:CubicO group peptidase (beta-lactamase class C family)